MKNEKIYEYVIGGDYEICGKIHSCLIALCGTSKENAAKKFLEIKANPPKDCLGNIRIEAKKSKDCWWNQGNLD